MIQFALILFFLHLTALLTGVFSIDYNRHCYHELQNVSPYGLVPIQQATENFKVYKPSASMYMAHLGFKSIVEQILEDAKTVLDRIHISKINKIFKVLGISFDFTLKDVDISDYNISKVNVILPKAPGDMTVATITDAFIIIVFNAEILAKTIGLHIGPAFGQVDMTFSGTCDLNFYTRGMNSDCPYHLFLDESTGCVLNINQLHFHLEGETFVNSIIQLIFDQLKDFFGYIVGTIMTKAVVTRSRDTLAARTEAGPILLKKTVNKAGNICMDRRITDVLTSSTSISFFYSGIVLNKTKASLETVPKIDKMPLTIPTAEDVAYTQTLDVFVGFYTTLYRDEPGIFDYTLKKENSNLDKQGIEFIYSCKNGLFGKIFPSVATESADNDALQIRIKHLEAPTILKTGPRGMLSKNLMSVEILGKSGNLYVQFKVDPSFVVRLDSKHREHNLPVPGSDKVFHGFRWTLFYDNYIVSNEIYEVLKNNTKDPSPQKSNINLTVFLDTVFNDYTKWLTFESLDKEYSYQIYESPFYKNIVEEGVIYRDSYIIWWGRVNHNKDDDDKSV